ncbi:MAG: NTP transferase domain-containing protein [Chloroflexota bacterium]
MDPSFDSLPPPVVGAVILAAGQSRRMGQPKMALPWGDTTVIGRVAQVLLQAGAGPVVAVTGGARQTVEAALQGLPVQCAHNPRFAEDQMAFSLQTGLQALPPGVDAALVALGDQPQLEVGPVRQVLAAYRAERAPLVIPSFEMRRGHPWLIDRRLWPEALALQPPATLRQLLNAHAAAICYVTVDSASILADLDTPEDYQRARPGAV